MPNSDIITAFISTIPALTLPLIDTWLKPKLSEVFKARRINDQLIKHSFENKFQEYLNRSYQRYSIVNTLAFHNQQKLLKNLYIPLTVSADNKDKKFTITEYEDDLIPVFKKVLITDTAGMGKSTILKWMFLSIVEKNEGIPIVIELRKLNKENTILSEIIGQLSPINEEIDNEFVLELILRGDFIFLFDGFDEIPFDDRKEVSNDLRNFITKANKNLFVITSRPESALSSFGDFQQFRINPLTQNEAYQLLRKYDEKGEITDKLISKIEESSYANISEFLTNPMLVSLLFTAFEHKHVIPLKKHIFYRQVYDALFESHDLTKGDFYIREKLSNLDSDDFHRVMRYLGFSTMKLGKIEYNKDEILKQLTSAKEFNSSLNFNEADFLYDLITSVPLFMKEGIYYRWAHKSIQDYFTAQFICTDTKGQQEEILIKLYKNNDFDKHSNIMDLAYDIDFKSFRKSVIREFINNLIDHYETTYTSSDFDPVLVQERQSFTFTHTIVVIRDMEFVPPVLNNKTIDSQTEERLNTLEKLVESYLPHEDYWLEFIEVFDNTLLSYAYNSYLDMTMLLFDKKMAFIDRFKSSDFRKTYFGSAQSLKFDIEDKKPYLINDDPRSSINSKINFPQINTLIKLQVNPLYIFDLEIAKQELISIENEIREESKADFFI